MTSVSARTEAIVPPDMTERETQRHNDQRNSPVWARAIEQSVPTREP